MLAPRSREEETTMPPINAMPDVWTDWMKGQASTVLLWTPKDRHELVALMRSVSDLRALRMRARGSGHSSSDIAVPRTGSFLVDFRRFVLDHADVAASWWKAGWKTAAPGAIRGDATLVRLAGCTSIAKANAMLAKETPARAFLNLGSYDAQTIAGAVATATHGSGMASGPIADFVASIELVTVVPDADGAPVVQSFRIEPANGITDRARFEAAEALHGMKLVQEDDVFYSAVVGLGCFGVVTAVTLQVVPAFSFLEHHELLAWSQLRSQVPQLSQRDYFDFIMTPLPRTTEVPVPGHQCLTTWRRVTPPSAADAKMRKDARVDRLLEKWPQYPSRARMTRYLSTKGSNNALLSNRAAWIHAFSEEAERYPANQPFRASSAVTFRNSIGDWVYATSIEVAVRHQDAAAAVDQVIAHAAAMHEVGLHHLSPYGVRFMRASRHHMAPAYGRDTCTIEAPILLGARRKNKDASTSPLAIDQMIAAFYHRFEAWPLPARFHWGQRHLTDAQDARRTYPAFAPKWVPAMRRFNPFGTFDNPFTDRLGLSV
jgi:L-gulono-1,4-lactone dehydrogenase